VNLFFFSPSAEDDVVEVSGDDEALMRMGKWHLRCAICEMRFCRPRVVGWEAERQRSREEG